MECLDLNMKILDLNMKAGFKYERLYLNVKIFYFLIVIINSSICHESTGTVLKVLLEEFLY